jgi:hypothetical protein
VEAVPGGAHRDGQRGSSGGLRDDRKLAR